VLRHDGDSSLTWGFVDPAILTGHRSSHNHDGGAILIVLRGCGALIEKGPPLIFLASVLPVCAWRCPLIYTTPASPIPTLTLEGGARVIVVIPHQF
jgi:hypothetical protein